HLEREPNEQHVNLASKLPGNPPRAKEIALRTNHAFEWRQRHHVRWRKAQLVLHIALHLGQDWQAQTRAGQRQAQEIDQPTIGVVAQQPPAGIARSGDARQDTQPKVGLVIVHAAVWLISAVSALRSGAGPNEY